MLRSLRIRLLAVVVAVGVVAIAATAMIAQQVATNDMRDTLELRVQTRGQVMQALTDFVVSKSTWHGADAEVDRLADTYNERVALYSIEGDRIADSDPAASLPPQPVGAISIPVDPMIVMPDVNACGGSPWVGEMDGQVVVYANGANAECLDRVLESYETPVSALLYVGTGEGESASVLGPNGPNRRLITVGMLVLLGSMVVMALALRPVLAPIGSLRSGARELEAGHLDTRVSERGASELTELAQSFNSMAASLQADRERQQRWTSDTAHELRNPVQNLKGHLEAAKDGLMDADDLWLDSMLDEVDQLGHLVADLGTLTLSDAGQIELDHAPLELGEIVDDIATAHGARAAQAKVSLTATGSAQVEGDARRLRQAISNLVDNALRHTPEGGSVTIEVLEAEDAEDHAEVRVTDTGDGIPAEAQERIFDRFARVDAHRARRSGGTGLGLSIVSALVEAHGGSVTVTSEESVGSTFVVALPRTQRSNAPEDANAR